MSRRNRSASTTAIATPIAAAAGASHRVSPAPMTAAKSGPSSAAVKLNCSSVYGVFQAGRAGTR